MASGKFLRKKGVTPLPDRERDQGLNPKNKGEEFSN
jgi:hypothetical protein